MLAFGAALILVILVGVVGYVAFDTIYQTPRTVIAEIGDVKVELRDVLPQTRLDLSASGQVSITGSVNDYARNLIFKERSGDLGLAVDSAEVDARIIARFELRDEQGELPAELTDLGRTAFENFLDVINVTEQDYRDWVEGQAIQDQLQDYFEAQGPDEVEQVFLNWIIAESVIDNEAAIARIVAGDPFGSVAAEVNIEGLLSDEQGVVGWVPEDAFDQLDSVLFSDTLELNTPIGPLTTSFGSMVLQVTDGPSVQPVSEPMRILVGANRLQQWMDTQTLELVTTLVLSVDDAQWIRDHL